MSLDNPYTSPEAPLAPSANGPGLAKPLAKWGMLTLLNAIASLSLARQSVSRETDDFHANDVGLPFYSLPQMLAGMAIIAVSLALLDSGFRRHGRTFLSRALTYGAFAKAALQLLLVVDLIIGLMAIGLVNSMPGRGGAFAVLFATLLCGAMAVCAAFGIGVILAAIKGAFPKPTAPQVHG